MKQVGWEIQPLGWLFLIVIVATLCYVVVSWVRRLPRAPEQETSPGFFPLPFPSVLDALRFLFNHRIAESPNVFRILSTQVDPYFGVIR